MREYVRNCRNFGSILDSAKPKTIINIQCDKLLIFNLKAKPFCVSKVILSVCIFNWIFLTVNTFRAS